MSSYARLKVVGPYALILDTLWFSVTGTLPNAGTSNAADHCFTSIIKLVESSTAYNNEQKTPERRQKREKTELVAVL